MHCRLTYLVHLLPFSPWRKTEVPPEKKEQFARAATQLSAGNICFKQRLIENTAQLHHPISKQSTPSIMNQVTYFFTADLLLELSHLPL
jgi:hypothetical protein